MEKDRILLPANLLYKSEVDFLKSSNICVNRTKSTVLGCTVYHINESDLDKVINTAEQGSRSLAIRIVSKALQIRKPDPEVRASLLAVASGLGGWSPVECDRILRAI